MLEQLLFSCLFELEWITWSYDILLTRTVSDSLLPLLVRFRNTEAIETKDFKIFIISFINAILNKDDANDDEDDDDVAWANDGDDDDDDDDDEEEEEEEEGEEDSKAIRKKN